MTIKPYWCSSTVTDTTLCVTAGERVKIFNKRRDNFKLRVRAGLTLNSIHIDSLDSIILRKFLHDLFKHLYIAIDTSSDCL